MNKHIPGAAAAALFAALISFGAKAAPIHNIVIVHGALADGSGWRRTTELLEQQGFNVSVVQEPITSLEDDVAATNRVIDLQEGPVLLVGHSYGGMVITDAGNNPKVAGLVYVAAFEPAKGESLIDLAGSKPPAGNSVKETKDGKYLYLDPAAFTADFAADAPKDVTAFMAKSQVFAAKQAFVAKAGEPAWTNKKSWAVVASRDRSINPDLEREMAKRAGSRVTEINSSHAVFLAHAEQLASVIEAAARKVGR